MKNSNNIIVMFLYAGILGMSYSASADGDRPKEETGLKGFKETIALVEKAIPEIFQADNSKLVSHMLNPVIGKQLPESFDRSSAIKQIFGRVRPSFSPNCRRILTAQGDKASDNCDVTSGSEKGEGQFIKLSFSKDMGNANIAFLKRTTKVSDPFSIPSVKMDDLQAFEIAKEFLANVLGASTEEIPQPPKDAKLPVRSVNLGFSDGKNTQIIPAVEKLVMMPRGFALPKDSPLDFVRGPGMLKVALTDKGVQRAAIIDWSDMTDYGKKLSPKNAKPRAELVREIATKLVEQGQRKLHAVKCIPIISLPDGTDILMPAMRVFASPVPSDLSEKDQANVISSAGIVFDIPLLSIAENASVPE